MDSFLWQKALIYFTCGSSFWGSHLCSGIRKLCLQLETISTVFSIWKEKCFGVEKRVDRILMEIDMSKGLLENMGIDWWGHSFSQPMDYTRLPFRCNHCHSNGHLVKECHYILGPIDLRKGIVESINRVVYGYQRYLVRNLHKDVFHTLLRLSLHLLDV